MFCGLLSCLIGSHFHNPTSFPSSPHRRWLRAQDPIPPKPPSPSPSAAMMAEWGAQQGPQSIEHPLNPRTPHSTAVPQFPHHREVVANHRTAPALRPPLSNAPISARGTGPAHHRLPIARSAQETPNKRPPWGGSQVAAQVTSWGKRWPWRGQHGNVAQGIGRNGECPLRHGDNTSGCNQCRARSLQAVCTPAPCTPHYSCSQGTTVTPKGGKSGAVGMDERWGQGRGWTHPAAGPRAAPWRGCRPIAGTRFPHAQQMLGVFRAGCVDMALRPRSSALAQPHAWPRPLLTIKIELRAPAKSGTAPAGCHFLVAPTPCVPPRICGDKQGTPLAAGGGPLLSPAPADPVPCDHPRPCVTKAPPQCNACSFPQVVGALSWGAEQELHPAALAGTRGAG